MEKKPEILQPITSPDKFEGKVLRVIRGEVVTKIIPHVPSGHELSPLAQYLYERHHRDVNQRHGNIIRGDKRGTV